MKVLLINGSPHEHGCTWTALSEVASALEQEGIQTEFFWIGKSSTGCMGCGACGMLNRCVIDDAVNVAAKKLSEADGVVVGSPVHYAAASGNVTAFLDRLFYSGKAAFAHKPAAAVVSARRAGTTAALDQLNKYFTLSRMPVVSSQYWNMVHGSTPEQVKQDEEGMQIMRTLGKNMAWLIKCIEAGKANGISAPEMEPVVRTNFIR